MKEFGRITLADAIAYIKVIEFSKSAKIADPIGYLTAEITAIEKELELLRNGRGNISGEMTREERIEWCLESLEIQKAYLACYQKMPLCLTADRYYIDLINLAQEGVIPDELKRFLKDIIKAYLEEDYAIVATESQIQLAKIYLQGGIILSDSGGNYPLDVMVVVPENKDEKFFFVLVKKYPGGELKYLKDL